MNMILSLTEQENHIHFIMKMCVHLFRETGLATLGQYSSNCPHLNPIFYITHNIFDEKYAHICTIHGQHSI